jgi:ArsR family transcriptional regulator
MFVLDEPQSKVSRHLAYLKHSGLTNSKRAGVWMHYWLKEPVDNVYRAQLDFLKGQLSHLTQFRMDREKLLELKKQGGCENEACPSLLMGINPVRNSSRCDSKPSGALFLTG